MPKLLIIVPPSVNYITPVKFLRHVVRRRGPIPPQTEGSEV